MLASSLDLDPNRGGSRTLPVDAHGDSFGRVFTSEPALEYERDLLGLGTHGDKLQFTIINRDPRLQGPEEQLSGQILLSFQAVVRMVEKTEEVVNGGGADTEYGS
jgi:hypothetical protein